jgi:hypothetical protein
MSKRSKRKDIPFDVEHSYKSYTLKDGTIFWAKSNKDAVLYRSKLGE